MDLADNLKIDTFSKELSASHLNSLVRLYIEIFTNGNGHYLITKKDYQVTSIKELGGSEFWDFEEIIGHYKHMARDYWLWHDPTIVQEVIKKKTSADSQTVLLWDKPSNELQGFCFGNKCTLMDAWNNEEWCDPFRYSNMTNIHKTYRNTQDFIVAVNKGIIENKSQFSNLDHPIQDYSSIYCWSALGLHPRWKNKGIGKVLRRSFINSIPKDYLDLLILVAECHQSNKSYEVNKRCGAIEVMTNGDQVIFIAPLQKFLSRMYDLE